MHTIISVMAAGVLGMLVCFLAVVTLGFWRKSQIESSLAIECGSGDSEVMRFNYNFKRGEGSQSKVSKMFEAFHHIESRREENHQKFLAIQAKAQEENLKRDPSELTMGKLSQIKQQKET